LGESSQPDDLAQLRATFPDWVIESRWVTSASGPDRHHFLARKDDVILTAPDAQGLVAQIAPAVLAAALRGQTGAR
jgi:hypothetical protein